MVRERLSRQWFQLVHRHNLVYNTCWEDPRLDRVALDLSADDDVLVITSAGCNALDYALAGPRQVHAVDMNPLQNALLELKLAGIRSLEFDEFFDLFGRGQAANWDVLYRDRLRPQLSPTAQACWDRRGAFFTGHARRKSFYFRGSSGTFAWLVNVYIDRVAKVRSSVNELLAAGSVDEQLSLFQSRQMMQAVWTPFVQWALQRDTTLSMLGVPRGQRLQLDREYPGGIGQFIKDRIETVFTRLPLHDNYFWRVYLTGAYTPECCPDYLKPKNFEFLKAGAVDAVQVHTNSVQGFLESHPGTISRFVLLDHMDWLSNNQQGMLVAEWQAILARATDNARIIWRSAGLSSDFVTNLQVRIGSTGHQLGELLAFQHELAAELHQQDRVNTYGSFYIADLTAV